MTFLFGLLKRLLKSHRFLFEGIWLVFVLLRSLGHSFFFFLVIFEFFLFCEMEVPCFAGLAGVLFLGFIFFCLMVRSFAGCLMVFCSTIWFVFSFVEAYLFVFLMSLSSGSMVYG